MSRFMHDVVADLQGGRETWRVFLALCAPSAIISITLALI